MTIHKLILAGFGGQGVMLMGQLIAYAAMYEGKEVTWMPSYGPEMRGGTANCSVIVSDKRISSPLITEATAVVAMNQPSMAKFENIVMPGGKFFLNTSLIKKLPDRNDLELYQIDANQIAEDLHNEKVSNMVILGAVVRMTGIVSQDSIEKAMEKLFTGNKEILLPLNIIALTAWRAY